MKNGIYGKYDFREMLTDIRKVYDIPSGKKLNLEFYEFEKDKGRWHIQVRAGKGDGLASGYDPGQGEWWAIEQWLKNPVPPVLLPM